MNTTATRTGVGATLVLVGVGAAGAGVHAGLAPEHLHDLGVCTSALEAAGVGAAVRLGRPRRSRRLTLSVTPGGTP